MLLCLQSFFSYCPKQHETCMVGYWLPMLLTNVYRSFLPINTISHGYFINIAKIHVLFQNNKKGILLAQFRVASSCVYLSVWNRLISCISAVNCIRLACFLPPAPAWDQWALSVIQGHIVPRHGKNQQNIQCFMCRYFENTQVRKIYSLIETNHV